MKLGDVKDLAVLGALGVGAYLLYKAVGTVPAVLKSTGEAIGSGLYDYFNPDTFGETTMHIVSFPDGQKHSVPSRSVDSTGKFLNKYPTDGSPYSYAGDGKTYRLVVSRANGGYVAVPV